MARLRAARVAGAAGERPLPRDEATENSVEDSGDDWRLRASTEGFPAEGRLRPATLVPGRARKVVPLAHVLVAVVMVRVAVTGEVPETVVLGSE